MSGRLSSNKHHVPPHYPSHPHSSITPYSHQTRLLLSLLTNIYSILFYLYYATGHASFSMCASTIRRPVKRGHDRSPPSLRLSPISSPFSPSPSPHSHFTLTSTSLSLQNQRWPPKFSQTKPAFSLARHFQPLPSSLNPTTIHPPPHILRQHQRTKSHIHPSINQSNQRLKDIKKNTRYKIPKCQAKSPSKSPSSAVATPSWPNSKAPPASSSTLRAPTPPAASLRPSQSSPRLRVISRFPSAS